MRVARLPDHAPEPDGIEFLALLMQPSQLSPSAAGRRDFVPSSVGVLDEHELVANYDHLAPQPGDCMQVGGRRELDRNPRLPMIAADRRRAAVADDPPATGLCRDAAQVGRAERSDLHEALAPFGPPIAPPNHDCAFGSDCETGVLA
jgi:hypothetical protein